MACVFRHRTLENFNQNTGITTGYGVMLFQHRIVPIKMFSDCIQWV